MNKLKKIPVGVLGATGMVGQKFVELLVNHPWFELVAVAASERSQNRKYKDATDWKMSTLLPSSAGELIIQNCQPILPCQIVFSGLDSKVAGNIEYNFANEGYIVISNSKNHRMSPTVPLLIPEVNPDHLFLIRQQPFSKGMIVTNPNCSTIGLTMALKPLINLCKIEKLHVSTLQAVSGAGYPGLSSIDILDNVIPFISGEEEKIEIEPLKILGGLNVKEKQIDFHDLKISAQCHRVNVSDGHMVSVSFKCNRLIEEEQIIAAWNNFKAEPQYLNLPSAPINPIVYFHEEKYPQPKQHRLLEKGMAVAIGRLRKCPLFDWKFSLVSHNTIRGAAGGSILIAELMVKKGYVH